MSLPLEQQVCSLELSKKLKELGVKQESLWYWKCEKTNETEFYELDIQKSDDLLFYKVISAFTVAELGKMLSIWAVSKVTGSDRGQPDEWECATITDPTKFYREKTEADARAKMLIHLIEQGIVKVKKC